MRSGKIADVIIFSQRSVLSRIATDHLKMKGISSIVDHDNAADTQDSLTRFQKGLLIIDWNVGDQEVVKVLSFNRKRHPDQMRPILLIVDKVSDQIIATAAEYSVTQIFSEEPTLKNLGARLTSLIMVDALPSDIKKVLNEVEEARKIEDWKLSLVKLQKALAKHPNNQRLKCEAAESLIYMKDYDNALKILEPFKSGKPPYLRGMHMLGRCLLKLGRADEAQSVLSTTMLFNPHDTDRLVELGRALFQLDRYQEANNQFDAALAIESNNHDALIGKSQVAMMDGDANDALAILQEVSTPLEMASIFNTCAVLTMRKGKHDAGMGLYRTAMKAIGNNSKLQARLYFNMGIGYRRRGQKEKAKSCYETALKLDPKFKKAHEHIEQLSSPPPETVGKDFNPGLQQKDEAAIPPQNPNSMPDFTADLKSLLDDDLDETLFKGAS